MLRANLQVLRPGGRLAFTTIEVADGLDPDERRRAVAAGPPAVEADAPHVDLLARAGFDAVERQDVTPQFRAVLEAWIAAAEELGGALDDPDVSALLDERVAERRVRLAAVRAGSLLRTRYLGTRPPS